VEGRKAISRAGIMNDLNNARFGPQPERDLRRLHTRPHRRRISLPLRLDAGLVNIFRPRPPTQLDQIEAILGVIPLARVEEMQANLMLIRDAFIYAIDEWPQDELTEKGTDVLGAA